MHPLIPLLILFLFIIIAGVIGFIIYSIATDIADKTSKKMENHNVSVGKDGLKIGLKEIKQEDYVGRTQDVLVKAWNLSTWPAYKSRFWNKKEEGKKGKSVRPSAVRGESASAYASAKGGAGASGTRVHHRSHEHGAEHGRLAEPRPAAGRTVSGSPIPGAFD